MAYVIVTTNGNAFAFEADDVTEVHGEYYFSLDGETVGLFRKDGIIGYYCTTIEDWDEEEDDY